MTAGPAYKELHRRFQEQDDREFREAVKAVLSTKEGRTLLRHLIEKTCIYAQIPLNHLEYEAGVRNVGLALLAECNGVSPELVQQAQTERNEVMRERNEQLKAAQALDERNRIHG